MVDIGLIDIGGKMPNLALMKLSSYYKTQGKTVILGQSGSEATFISCIFSRFREIAAERVERFGAAVGGPGWDSSITLPPEIEICRPDYSLYGIDYGLGRLTSGCPAGCEFCVVPQTEGLISRTVAQIGDIANGDFLVLLDSNILACEDWIDHFREIRERDLTVCFTQGLDIRRITELAARELARLKVRELHGQKPRLWFAWDRPEDEAQVREGVKELQKAGIKPWRLRFFVLTGYNTSFEQDIYRVETLRGLGAGPFVMKFESAGQQQCDLARWCNRPQLREGTTFEEYEKTQEAKRRLRRHEGQLSLELP